jgi:hypothetical protein
MGQIIQTNAITREMLTQDSLANIRAYLETLSSTQVAAAYQPLDSDLTEIAALTTQVYGRSLLTLANQADLQTAHGVTADNGVVDQVFSETITWSGNTAPSGTANHRYQWYRVGKIVFFRFKLEWSVLGISLTAAQFLFPSGFPAPATMSNDANGEALLFGSGGVGTVSLGGSTTSSSSVSPRLQLTSGGALEARVSFGTAGIGSLYFNGWYRCA